MRIAIVHDWLTVAGGAERVLETLLQLFPEADVFTLFYDPARLESEAIASRPIRTSFLDRIPTARRHHRILAPLFPLAVEQFDVSQYDVVISNTFSVAHGVVTGPNQVHIAYVNRTMQYAWESYHADLQSFGVNRGWRNIPARLGFHYLRLWDFQAFQRPDILVANSAHTARRIKKHYHRESVTIHPPVSLPATAAASQTVRGDHYLFVGRLVPVKRPDLLVKAFRINGLHLRVIGDGPMKKALQSAAGPRTEFLGWRSRDEVLEEMSRARALVFPSEEAFGIVAVEAQGVGTPVIGYRGGGAAETVVDGRTGVLYETQTVPALAAAIAHFETISETLDPDDLRQQARAFAPERFGQQILEVVKHARQLSSN